MSLSDPVGRLRQRKHVRKFDNSENVAYLSYDALADKNQHSFVIHDTDRMLLVRCLPYAK